MAHPARLPSTADDDTAIDQSPDEDQKQRLAEQLEKQRNSLSTDRLDMSYGEILSMYDREELVIDPEFQRLFRWDICQMSRFLESVLLGIPIPPIFVAENDDGEWELVDGLQRTATLLSFFGLLYHHEKNNWKCDAVDLIPDLQGFGYRTLPRKFLLNIKRAPCRIEILRWKSQHDMRYELFSRLNTGGSPLTDQEIRNCIYRGVDATFNRLLKRASDHAALITLVCPTETQEKTLYMQELVLRFLSLHEGLEDFKAAYIKEHMTAYMKKAVHEGFDDHVVGLFFEVLDLLMPFGKDVFRFERSGFSSSLFDAITVGMAKNIVSIREMKSEELEEKIIQLKADGAFRGLTGSAASGKARVVKRVQKGIEWFS